MSKLAFWIVYPLIAIVGFAAIFVPLSFWLGDVMGYWGMVITIPGGYLYGTIAVIVCGFAWDSWVRES